MASIIKFTLKELNALINDANSCVSKKTVTQNIALQPWHLANLKDSVEKIMEYKIGKFDKELNGIILSYKNVKILDDICAIRQDSSEMYSDAQVDLFVFQPYVGATLHGFINKKSDTHLGILVHKVFNVVIPRPVDEPGNKWIGAQLAEGQRVTFKIVMLDLFGALPYIRGCLDESSLRAITDDLDLSPKCDYVDGLVASHVNFDGTKPKSAITAKSLAKRASLEKIDSVTNIKISKHNSQESSSESEMDVSNVHISKTKKNVLNTKKKSEENKSIKKYVDSDSDSISDVDDDIMATQVNLINKIMNLDKSQRASDAKPSFAANSIGISKIDKSKPVKSKFIEIPILKPAKFPSESTSNGKLSSLKNKFSPELKTTKISPDNFYKTSVTNKLAQDCSVYLSDVERKNSKSNSKISKTNGKNSKQNDETTITIDTVPGKSNSIEKSKKDKSEPVLSKLIERTKLKPVETPSASANDNKISPPKNERSPKVLIAKMSPGNFYNSNEISKSPKDSSVDLSNIVKKYSKLNGKSNKQNDEVNIIMDTLTGKSKLTTSTPFPNAIKKDKSVICLDDSNDISKIDSKKKLSFSNSSWDTTAENSSISKLEIKSTESYQKEKKVKKSKRGEIHSENSSACETDVSSTSTKKKKHSKSIDSCVIDINSKTSIDDIEPNSIPTTKLKVPKHSKRSINVDPDMLRPPENVPIQESQSDSSFKSKKRKRQSSESSFNASDIIAADDVLCVTEPKKKKKKRFLTEPEVGESSDNFDSSSKQRLKVENKSENSDSVAAVESDSDRSSVNSKTKKKKKSSAMSALEIFSQIQSDPSLLDEIQKLLKKAKANKSTWSPQDPWSPPLDLSSPPDHLIPHLHHNISSREVFILIFYFVVLINIIFYYVA